MDTLRQQDIFFIILKNEPIGTSGILDRIAQKVSIPTINRELSKLKEEKIIFSEGRGPGTKYRINLHGLISANINPEDYFKIDIDNRKILEKYNPSIFDSLKEMSLFTKKEIGLLDKMTHAYNKKLERTSTANYKREFERLMIELSWKSSQIEGNTYDLLDTEQLLKYNIPAPNHTEEEAIMLLNRNRTVKYIFLG
jgi:Fic family protein